jgi:hypothetical protein
MNKSRMKTRIVPVILLSLVSSLALAAGDDNQSQNNQGQNDQMRQWHDRGHAESQDHHHDRRILSAPELDPSQAVEALLLLSGALAVIRGYRRKK